MNIFLLITIAIVVFALQASASKSDLRGLRKKKPKYYTSPPGAIVIENPLPEEPWHEPLSSISKEQVLRSVMDLLDIIIPDKHKPPGQIPRTVDDHKRRW